MSSFTSYAWVLAIRVQLLSTVGLADVYRPLISIGSTFHSLPFRMGIAGYLFGANLEENAAGYC
jgi:hypothetical protein